MSDGEQCLDSSLELESMERWVAGKDESDLLTDLKVYLARLRDDPRSIPDRLRVAAIQQRLGRDQEALIHYEGVLRGYVQGGRLMSAINLCQRMLARHPNLPRIQRLLTALYARAPHGATSTPSAVTPIPTLEDQPTTTFVVEQDEEAGTDRNRVVDRVFPEMQARRERPIRNTPPLHDDTRPTVPYEPVQRLSGGIEDIPTMPSVDRNPSDEHAVLLTTPRRSHAPAPEAVADDDDSELVVLLTKKKPK